MVRLPHRVKQLSSSASANYDPELVDETYDQLAIEFKSLEGATKSLISDLKSLNEAMVHLVLSLSLLQKSLVPRDSDAEFDNWKTEWIDRVKTTFQSRIMPPLLGLQSSLSNVKDWMTKRSHKYIDVQRKTPKPGASVDAKSKVEYERALALYKAIQTQLLNELPLLLQMRRLLFVPLLNVLFSFQTEFFQALTAIQCSHLEEKEGSATLKSWQGLLAEHEHCMNRVRSHYNQTANIIQI